MDHHFQSKEFAKFLSGLGIKHTTSSPGYLPSNGFIERHIQMVKNMLSKSSNTQSLQEVLADLRVTRIGTGLPSPCWDTPWKKSDNKGASGDRHKSHPFCVVGDSWRWHWLMTRVGEPRRQGLWWWVKGAMSWDLLTNGLMLSLQVSLTVAGAMRTEVEATGGHLTRNRSHIRPRSPDIPMIHASFLQWNSVLSDDMDRNAPSTRENSVISGPKQLAGNSQKTVLSEPHKGSIKTNQYISGLSFRDSARQEGPTEQTSQEDQVWGQPCEQHCGSTTKKAAQTWHLY